MIFNYQTEDYSIFTVLKYKYNKIEELHYRRLSICRIVVLQSQDLRVGQEKESCIRFI